MTLPSSKTRQTVLMGNGYGVTELDEGEVDDYRKGYWLGIQICAAFGALVALSVFIAVNV